MTATWHDRAACRDEDPELFFLDHGTHPDALAICARCPVAAECLEAALSREGGCDHRSRYGVWGGTTPEQRARMVRRQKRGEAAS